ncbi:A24 family peptidase [Asticcacaulis solisilvae]|uniref:A24 family peptidase n=1 Tax=Asticcacaulis solisilvae TaxID=1217274 RepID=UPI003FD8AF0A
MLIPLLFALVYPACLLWAAKTDIESMTISNRLTLGLAAAFLPAALLLGLSPEQWGVHLGLAFIGLIAGMVLFALRVMGGGDAKLIAATLIWLGGDGALAFLIYTALAGGALTLGLLWARRTVGQFASALPVPIGQHLEAKADIPYGVAICAGGLLAISHSDLLPLLHL